jgi:hypothetical protein
VEETLAVSEPNLGQAKGGPCDLDRPSCDRPRYGTGSEEGTVLDILKV